MSEDTRQLVDVIGDLEASKLRGDKRGVDVGVGACDISELSEADREKELFGLTAFVISYYWEDIEQGIDKSMTQISEGSSMDELMSLIYSNAVEKVCAKLDKHLADLSEDVSHMGDSVFVKVAERFAKIRDGIENDKAEALRSVSERVFEGMMQGAASALYLADAAYKSFESQYQRSLGVEQRKRLFCAVLEGGEFQRLIAKLGYGSGNAMGAANLSLFADDCKNRAISRESEVGHGKKLKTNFIALDFDSSKLKFVEQSGEYRLHVDGEVQGAIKSNYEGFGGGSDVVWGCPAGFAKTSEGKAVLPHFYKLLMKLFIKTKRLKND